LTVVNAQVTTANFPIDLQLYGRDRISKALFFSNSESNYNFSYMLKDELAERTFELYGVKGLKKTMT